SGSRRLAKITGQRIALHVSTWVLHAELHDFVDAPTRKNLASPQLDFNDRRQFPVFRLYMKNCGVRTLVRNAEQAPGIEFGSWVRLKAATVEQVLCEAGKAAGRPLRRGSQRLSGQDNRKIKKAQP
ncbi:hypothetical protein, partial [Bradyrhizobium sp. CCBAU 11357]|uniref:hypothetical protein n=1 Tax=Bradyrhizobium sp. CCBAU 11357 TaxID=1630808 RepID=UPI00230435EE